MGRIAEALRKIERTVSRGAHIEADMPGEPRSETTTSTRFDQACQPHMLGSHLRHHTRRVDTRAPRPQPHLGKRPATELQPSRQHARQRPPRPDGMQWEPDPAFRFEYESILASIRGRVKLQDSVVVAIFSSSDQGRTSDLIVDLGRTLVGQGESRTLLVDADMLERRLTHLWQAEEQLGLAEAFRAPAAWARYLQFSENTPMPLLPAGSGFLQMSDPTEPLAAMIREWKQSFRWVLIDAGITTGWPAEALAVCADAVVLHSDFRVGPTQDFRAAVSRLREVGSRMVGSVLTGREWDQVHDVG